MAYANAVKYIAASSGTGDFVVSSAALGFQTPQAAGVLTAWAGSYRAESANLSEWEYGTTVLTISGGGTVYTFTRVVVGNSLGTTAKINFTAPPAVGLTASAEDLANAALLLTGLIAQARLGSGSLGTGTKALFDDQTFKTITATGRLISRQTLYSTNSSLAPPAGATSCIFRLQASGGGSSGRAANACFPNPTRPGGAGAYLEGYIPVLVGNLNVTLGAVGAAAASGANAGGNASNSTVVHNGNTWTAPGGNGAPNSATLAADSTAPTVVNSATDWGVKGEGAFMSNVNQTQISDRGGRAQRGPASSNGSGSANNYGSGAPNQTSGTTASAGVAGGAPMFEVEWYT